MFQEESELTKLLSFRLLLVSQFLKNLYFLSKFGEWDIFPSRCSSLSPELVASSGLAGLWVIKWFPPLFGFTSTSSLLFGTLTVSSTACRNWCTLEKGACHSKRLVEWTLLLVTTTGLDFTRVQRESRAVPKHSVSGKNDQDVLVHLAPFCNMQNCSDPQSPASEPLREHKQMTAHWQMTKVVLTDDRNKYSGFATYEYNYCISIRTMYRLCWMYEQEDQSSRPSVVMKQHASAEYILCANARAYFVRAAAVCSQRRKYVIWNAAQSSRKKSSLFYCGADFFFGWSLRQHKWKTRWQQIDDRTHVSAPTTDLTRQAMFSLLIKQTNSWLLFNEHTQ